MVPGTLYSLKTLLLHCGCLLVAAGCYHDHEPASPYVGPTSDSPKDQTVSNAIKHTLRVSPAFTLSVGKRRYAVPAIAFSNDGKHLATGSTDRAVRVWSLDTRQVVKKLSMTHEVYSVCFADKRNILLGGCWGNRIVAWDTRTFEKVYELSSRVPGSNPMSLCLSPDGAQLLVASDAGVTPSVWDLTTRMEEVLPQDKGREYPVYYRNDDVAFIPGGKYLVSANSGNRKDNVAVVYRCDTFERVAELAGHHRPLYSVACSPDGKYIATGGSDSKVRVWAVDEFDQVAVFSHDYFVKSVAFTPDNQYLVAGCLADSRRSGVVKVYSMTRHNEVVSVVAGRRGVKQVAVSPDGKLLAAAVGEKVELWHMNVWSASPH